MKVGLQGKVGEPPDSHASKGRPEKNDGGNLNAPAEVAVEWKPLYDGKDAYLGKPCANPVKRRREKAGEQHHPSKVGKEAQESLKTGRFGIHDMISMS